MKHWTRRFLLAPVAVVGFLSLSAGSSAQVNISTSFEPIDFALGSTDFVLGTPPDSAHFTGGVTLTVGNPFAYRTGIASWGVLNMGGVGVIDFDNPASAVSFYAINLGGGSGFIEVFDDSDSYLGSIAIVSTDMMNNDSLISFTSGDYGGAEIGKVTMTNDVGAGSQAWMDDFSATVNTPVPEPATVLVVATGLIYAAARRRRNPV